MNQYTSTKSTVSSTSTTPTNPDVKRGDRIVGGSIVFVAIRCTLQYVVLPFILPFFGRPPIDAFFDKVTVNAENPVVRRNRLCLLTRVAQVMRRVAIWDAIEG
jgi:hypothetical protein